MKDIIYTGQKALTLEIVGLRRQLPVVEVAANQWIASFVLLGDTELVERCGRALARRLDKWRLDCLIVPEGRGLALTHVIAASLSTGDAYVPYIVARKGVKPYMQNPLIGVVNTITTAGEQVLALDGADANRLQGRRVCVVDDLISTGGTTRAVAKLAAAAGAEVCCVAAVLLEGEDTLANPSRRTNGIPVVWLQAIPQFKSG
jgi:adenine phosphoribosyltransferase